ncbi:MAG: hypothetical protein ACRCUH_15230 [Shewanella sp.]
MSESKSNDLFTGEICYEHEPLSECFKFSIQDDIGVILGAWHEGMADFACTAIGSYYANQELITKQAEQIKMLRDALKKCITCSDNLDFEAGWMAIGIDAAEKALEATKPDKE